MMIWRGLSPKLVVAAFARRRSVAGAGTIADPATEKPRNTTADRHATRPGPTADRLALTGKPRGER